MRLRQRNILETIDNQITENNNNNKTNNEPFGKQKWLHFLYHSCAFYIILIHSPTPSL